MDNATPVEIEGDVTVRLAPETMEELVFGPAPCTCGEVHPPEDDTYYPGAL